MSRRSCQPSARTERTAEGGEEGDVSDYTLGRDGGQGRRSVILLVEDNPADAELTREALAESRRDNLLCVVRTGEDAVAFLRREGHHVTALRPDLVLLDLNLPGLDGCGVLAEIRRDAELRSTPVVVLSSSAAPDDVVAAYRLGANCFVTKPLDLERYLATVRAIEQYWLAVATLPT